MVHAGDAELSCLGNTTLACGPVKIPATQRPKTYGDDSSWNNSITGGDPQGEAQGGRSPWALLVEEGLRDLPANCNEAWLRLAGGTVLTPKA